MTVEPWRAAAATRCYRDGQDVLGGFLAHTIAPAKCRHVEAPDLYRRYADWCKENNELPLSGRRFTERMVERGNTKRPMGARWVECWIDVEYLDRLPQDDGGAI